MILEIIELRTTNRTEVQNNNQLHNLISGIVNENQNVTITVYSSTVVPTDISIHIHYSQDSLQKNDHFIGHQIKALLSDWGLVNTTLWKEEQEGDFL